MGTLLTEIAASDDAPPRLELRVRARRVGFLVVLCAAALGVAAVLHGLDRETAAAWFTGMGEALLFAVFGMVVGEALGAMTAAERLLNKSASPNSR